MSISIDFLDLLYDEWHSAIANEESLKLDQSFPDNGYSDKVHNVNLQHATRMVEKSRNRICAYIEHHNKGGKS
jgi:transposase